jgi:hypothetical protein
MSIRRHVRPDRTARIFYMPFERLGAKVKSMGIPVSDGHLSLVPWEDAEVQELIYSGPNVMMGYMASAEGLAAGIDHQRGALHFDGRDQEATQERQCQEPVSDGSPKRGFPACALGVGMDSLPCQAVIPLPARCTR